jgi:hypothetical protein
VFIKLENPNTSCDFMKRSLVNLAILCSGKNTKTCTEGSTKMLAKGDIKDDLLNRVTVPHSMAICFYS